MHLYICRYFDFIQNLDGVNAFLKSRRKQFLSLPSLSTVSKKKFSSMQKKSLQKKKKFLNKSKGGNKGKGKGGKKGKK